MDHVQDLSAKQKRECEDTSVVEGNKKMSTPQFATKTLYQKYMDEQLKNGYGLPVSSENDIDEPEELGESVSVEGPNESVPEGSEDTFVPPVREIGKGRPTEQSSIEFGAFSGRAVDGRTDGEFSHGSCTHTKEDDSPWWRVDLGKTMNIQSVEIFNRADCCGDRLSNFQVRVGDAKLWSKNMKCGGDWSIGQGQSLKIPCTQYQGQYVFVVIPATAVLNLCEVKIMGSDNPGANAARGMPAEQSSTLRGGSADRAVDGHTNTDFKDNSCTHTEYELKPWWKVDLGKTHIVSAVDIWNRGDCCGSRLKNFEVRVGNNGAMWTASQKCGERWEIPEGEHKRIGCNKAEGRFAWVVLMERDSLTLCEVRVITEFAKRGKNIARNKPTEQSSTGYGGFAKRAVDGDINTDFKGGSCTHTHYDQEPWWRVDLEKSQAVGAVQIWNRGDCCGARLSNFEVRVGDGPKWQGQKICGDERQKIAQGMRKTILCAGAQGRFVYVVKRDMGYLNICEVRVLPFKGTKEEYASETCVAKALGLENRNIKSADVSASSFYGDIEEYGPNNARLNYRGTAWQPLHERIGEWVQVILPTIMTVTGVATQGSSEADKWVTEYKVRYLTGEKWAYVGGASPEEFSGNVDRNSVIQHDFKLPFKTSKVRIYPQNWKGAMAMRVELYGRTCDPTADGTPAAAAQGPGSAAVVAAVAAPCPPSSDGRRRRSIELFSENGYGEGVARLWYAAQKGGDDKKVSGHSLYVSEGVDFRTETGSIYAGKDLVAGKSLKINSWPGFGTGTAELWFAKRAQKTYKSNTLYLKKGDFATQEGSISASDSIRTGKYLEIGAYPGFGDKDTSAKLWYSAAAKSGMDYKSNTVYMNKGNMATSNGDIVSSKDVVAARYLSIKALANHGTGTASFMYTQSAKAPYASKTVYLKQGNLATADGSIISQADVEVGAFLKIKSMKGYGTGSVSMWYAKNTLNGFGPNTVYLQSGNFETSQGNVIAGKNLVAGRSVLINAYPGLGAGSAELKYSNVKNANFEANSLYLTSGDFRTQLGSIVAAKDVSAGRSLIIKSTEGHGTGQAEIFYSHTAKNGFAKETLYLKNGDFTTKAGSIRAGNTLFASKYVEINAYPGFGEGSAKLWHCNKEVEGFKPNSLYLKNGDFRTEDGSVHAKKDVVAGRYVTINAMEGFGTGSTRLWYSATGKDQYRSKSLYLDHGDFRTEAGSIHAAKDLHAGRYLKIQAWPGHGTGYAALWHSKMEQRGFGADTLYLNKGHMQIQEGSVIAQQDLHVGRYVKIGAKAGYGTGSTQLWYSGDGKDGVAAHSLMLDSGDLRAQDGDIVSSNDVVAKKKLLGASVETASAFVTGTVKAGHLFLGEAAQTPSGRRLLGEGKVEVGAVLTELAESNDALKSRNSALHADLKDVMARIASLEEVASRR